MVIKQRRIELGLTQFELELKSGVSYRTISRAENGKQISLTKLKALCEALKLNLNEVLK